jgi:hypothetical protein
LTKKVVGVRFRTPFHPKLDTLAPLKYPKTKQRKIFKFMLEQRIFIKKLTQRRTVPPLNLRIKNQSNSHI